jgi:thioredoxin reductase (NADPH)
VIVGGGNSAGQAAVFYSGYAAEVIVVVRGAGLANTMSQYLIQQIRSKTNIRVKPYTQVTAAHGEHHLEQITTTTKLPDGEESVKTWETKALFIMIGAVAKTDWLPKTLQRDAKGYICTGRDIETWSLDREPFALETSMPGVFCAGDVRHGSVKRVASGVGEGSMSISYIHEYLALTDAAEGIESRQ